jgi:FkbM family methyltransferase
MVKTKLKKMGWAKIEHPGLTLVHFLWDRDVDLVIDVGANCGQFGSYLRAEGYTGAILSIEPIEHLHAELIAMTATDPTWNVLRAAVGAHAGEVEINVSHSSEFSSIHAPNSTGAAFFGYKMEAAQKQVVPLVTLEDIADQIRGQRVFLKIDTQGYEREVLNGARTMMQRFVGIQLELPVMNIYENVWSFMEALQFMDALGFVPAQFAAVNPIVGDPASAIEFDCLFRQKTDRERP